MSDDDNDNEDESNGSIAELLALQGLPCIWHLGKFI